MDLWGAARGCPVSLSFPRGLMPGHFTRSRGLLCFTLNPHSFNGKCLRVDHSGLTVPDIYGAVSVWVPVFCLWNIPVFTSEAPVTYVCLLLPFSSFPALSLCPFHALELLALPPSLTGTDLSLSTWDSVATSPVAFPVLLLSCSAFLDFVFLAYVPPVLL